MPKTAVPACATCGKVPEVVIVWLKSGDTEWTCLDCHMVMVLAMVADNTEMEAAAVPE